MTGREGMLLVAALVVGAASIKMLNRELDRGCVSRPMVVVVFVGMCLAVWLLFQGLGF